MLDISTMTYEQRELIVLKTAIQFIVTVLNDDQKDMLHAMAQGSKESALESMDEDTKQHGPELFEEVINLFKNSDHR